MWLQLLIQIISLIIGSIESSEDCPGGICDVLKSDLADLQAEAAKPRANSIGDFLKCVDIKRLVAALSDVVKIVVEGLKGCPPQDPDVTV